MTKQIIDILLYPNDCFNVVNAGLSSYKADAEESACHLFDQCYVFRFSMELVKKQSSCTSLFCTVPKFNNLLNPYILV